VTLSNQLNRWIQVT
jgi:hypothetical protein